MISKLSYKPHLVMKMETMWPNGVLSVLYLFFFQHVLV